MKYKGRELAHPVVIIRRTIAFAFLHILRAAFCAVMWFGWGYYEAKRSWDEML